MGQKIIRPDRRLVPRRQPRLSALAEAVKDSIWADRRTYCWTLDPACTEERRKRCGAHFIERNCWDIWGAEYFPQGRRPCCHPEVVDCSDCSITKAKFNGAMSVYVPIPARAVDSAPHSRGAEALNCCTHLYSQRTNLIEASEDESRQSFRCQRRPGVLLHSSYVSDVCSIPEHRECIFYEED